MKLCNKCNKKQNETEFGFKNKKLNKRASICKTCHKAYSKDHYQQNTQKYKDKANKRNKERLQANREYITEIKKQGCSLCSESNPCCIDFHHTDPTTKSGTVSQMVVSYLSIQTIQYEVDKCVLLCSNCHRKVHNGDLSI